MKKTLLIFLSFLLLVSCQKPDSGIDVFYIISTDVLSATDSLGNVSWRATLTDEDQAAMQQEADWVQQHIFGEGFHFYAPLYHQLTFDALRLLPKDSLDMVYAEVSDEVCRLFDEYMTHQNGGRPFVLAGFSQGAMLTLDVLRHMSDEQYGRMVASYTMGYRVSEEDMQHSHIRPASDADQRGVTISYNSTQSIEAIWPLLTDGAATCMNPVNWTTDTTSAVFSYQGTTNRVHVDQQHQVLLVETDDPEYYRMEMDKMSFFGDAGVSRDNLHHWDLLFYAPYIHANALHRAGQPE